MMEKASYMTPQSVAIELQTESSICDMSTMRTIFILEGTSFDAEGFPTSGGSLGYGGEL